jgi:hypothetical protein
MKLLGRELVAGLKHPHKVPEGRLIIKTLPKKKNPPPLIARRDTVAWGLHAKMVSLSQRSYDGFLGLLFSWYYLLWAGCYS